MSYRDYYPATLDDIYQEEVQINHPYIAEQRARDRLRMYANLFWRDSRKKILKTDSCCAICGSKKSLNIDHIVPISKGGENRIENVQILCFSCNRKKSNK